MIEKLEPPDENQPQKRNSGLSRREFLKRAGGAVAFATIPFGETLFSETSRAWSKEVKEGDSWLEGIAALRDESLQSEFEHSAWFMRDQNNNEFWSRVVTGGKTDVEREDDFLLDLLKQNPKEIRYLHTHQPFGLKTFNISPDEIIQMIQKNERLPSIPPSVGDINITIIYQAMAQEQKPDTVLSHVIVEPNGLWEIKADLTHPYAKIILKYGKMLQKLKENLSEEEYTTIIQMSGKIISGPRPNPQKDPLMAEWYDLLNEDSAFNWDSLNFNIVTQNFITSGVRGIPDYTKMISVYKPLGTTVKFTDYKSLGL